MNKKFVNTLKAAVFYTHIHTHTHTHTDSLITSLKQIGTICFAFSFLIFPNFASAENIPTTNPGCTTTVLGADNVANRSAALEPDFSANTINTTWYSNGEQLTGNNIPGTCRYDAALTPPTPAPRPGYVFGGWKIKRCEIPSSLGSTNGRGYGFKSDSTGPNGARSYDASTYNLTEDNTWGAIWGNGDKVTGEAFCSTTDDGKSQGQTGNPGTIGGYAAGGQYCWCRATHYTANGGTQCALSSPAWVLYGYYYWVAECASYCVSQCAPLVEGNSDFRAAVFGSNVAQ